jgi:hypothetical protein
MAEPVITPKAQGPEQTPAQVLVSDWAKKIERASKDRKKRNEKIVTWRKRVAGDLHSDGAPGLVRTNLIFAHIATAVPNTYAKNPEIAVSPSDGVPKEKLKAVKKLAKVSETLLKRRFVRDGKLKKRARAALRSVFTVSDGWLKVSFIDPPPTQNPLSSAATDDVTDNLKRIEALKADIANATDETDRKLKEAQLAEQTAAVESGQEINPSRGIAIDKIRSEDMLILDGSVNEFDDYEQAGAIAHCIWYSRDEYETEFGAVDWTDSTADLPTLWACSVDENGQRVYSPNHATGEQRPPSNTNEPGYVRVWEIWHRTGKVIYVWADGRKDWCRAPSPPKYFGRRFFPFFRFGFNAIDGMVDGISDVALLEELQDEYNTTRTNFAEHRKEAIPVRLARKAGNLSDEDIKAIQNRKLNDILLVGGKPGKPLEEDLFEFKHVPLDPAVYDTLPIRSDMEMVVGRQDAEVGNIQKAKTATEASIMAQGSNTRSGYKNDTMEDVLTEMSEYVLQMFMQAYSPQEVAEVAGPEALEVWPQLNKEASFEYLSVEVIAGSMQKPNVAEELEKWTKLLPVLQDAILKMAELRAQGMVHEADAIAKLAQETVRRFEDRIDIETLLGINEDGEQSMVLQLQQENMQLKQAMAQHQEQMAQQDQQVKQAMTDAEAKGAEAQKMAADAEGKVAAVSKENEQLKQKAQVRETELQAQLRKQSGDLENQRREFETAQMKAGYESKIADLTKQIEAMTQQVQETPSADEPGDTEGQQGQQPSQPSQAEQLLSAVAQGLQAVMQELRDSRSGDVKVEYSPEGRVIGLKRSQKG